MALESFEGQPSVPSLSHARCASQLQFRQDFFKHLETIAAVTCLLSIFAVPVSISQAQCTGVCGDVDSNGFLGPADFFLLFSYISSADSAGMDLQCANVDDHAGVSLRDFVFLHWKLYLGWPLDCEIDSGPFVPMNDATYVLHHNSVFPAGDTAVTLYIDGTLGGADQTEALAIVVRVLVDGEVPILSEVGPTYLPGGIYDWEHVAFNGPGTGNIPAGYLMGTFWTADFGSPGPGRYSLGRAKLVMPASAQPRTITLELVEFPTGANKTMAHDGALGDTDVWALNLSSWIIDLTGDINNDRVLTASDVIGLVNYVFKGGAKPYPFAGTGDVNCSGAVTSSDIIEFVNHVFKSGPAPCNVTTECTITVDSWTCP